MNAKEAYSTLSESLGRMKPLLSGVGIEARTDVSFIDAKLNETPEPNGKTYGMVGVLTVLPKETEEGTELYFEAAVDVNKQGEVDENALTEEIGTLTAEFDEFLRGYSDAEDKKTFLTDWEAKQDAADAEAVEEIKKMVMKRKKILTVLALILIAFSLLGILSQIFG